MNYFPEMIEIDFKEELQHNPDVRWADYPKGVLKVLSDNGYNLKQGFDVLFFSEIPAGAGVSSSAAFEVVFAYGLADINGFKIDKKKIAVLCQKAENEFVGVSCGIMDQFAVTMGKKGNGILLNCATLEFEYVPLELNDYSLVLTNTNKKRGLIDSKYNERLGECREALARLQKQLKIKDLCSLDSKTLAANEGLIGDPVLYRRARHVVTENERVKIASQALRQGDLEQLGRVMRASHISLRDDYEVTGTELNTLYDEAKGHPGCIGTRMTGAGFGGCTISIVKTAAVDDFQKCVTAGYRSKTGLEPSFYICSVGDGVKKENYKRS
jgi:galactokinase